MICHHHYHQHEQQHQKRHRCQDLQVVTLAPLYLLHSDRHQQQTMFIAKTELTRIKYSHGELSSAVFLGFSLNQKKEVENLIEQATDRVADIDLSGRVCVWAYTIHMCVCVCVCVEVWTCKSVQVEVCNSVWAYTYMCECAGVEVWKCMWGRTMNIQVCKCVCESVGVCKLEVYKCATWKCTNVQVQVHIQYIYVNVSELVRQNSVRVEGKHQSPSRLDQWVD